MTDIYMLKQNHLGVIFFNGAWEKKNHPLSRSGKMVVLNGILMWKNIIYFSMCEYGNTLKTLISDTPIGHAIFSIVLQWRERQREREVLILFS